MIVVFAAKRVVWGPVPDPRCEGRARRSELTRECPGMRQVRGDALLPCPFGGAALGKIAPRGAKTLHSNVSVRPTTRASWLP
jgi:hypothetical protein